MDSSECRLPASERQTGASSLDSTSVLLTLKLKEVEKMMRASGGLKYTTQGFISLSHIGTGLWLEYLSKYNFIGDLSNLPLISSMVAPNTLVQINRTHGLRRVMNWPN